MLYPQSDDSSTRKDDDSGALCPDEPIHPWSAELKDFDTFYAIAQKVVDAMVDEYQVPMVLDQATVSNTNHHGHPPHADTRRVFCWKCLAVRTLESASEELLHTHIYIYIYYKYI